MPDIEQILKRQRAFFVTHQTKNIAFRMDALRRMEAWIRAHEEDLAAALKADLNKSPFEAYATEIGLVLDELRFALRHLGRWSRDIHVPSPLKQFPARSFIRHEPYGVALIMSPWNYPFQLTAAPLIAALAAGNCAVVKPSAYSPATSASIAEMVRDVFAEEYVTVITGGRTENESLLRQKFDCICFTGSVAVGKTVMEAAAKHLTPVTLELGGKSPCIVDASTDIALAAKRIAWGKFLNAGQTCVAPDYLLVQKSVRQKLVDGIVQNIRAFYGERPLECEELPKIINAKHFARLLGLMKAGDILCGGASDADALKIAPTLVGGVDWDDPVMLEEIFGPILPVLEFETLEEVVQTVNGRPKPLALYLFTRDKRAEAKILNEISFGGGCVNDTVVHLATSRMPFGGVGDSGMGGYHGKFGFDTFTHQKSVMKKVLWLDIPLRYPPYKDHIKWLKKL